MVVPFPTMAASKSPDKPPLAQLTVKVPKDVEEAYDASAAASGMTRHRWMRVVLDAASGRSELPQQLMRVVKFIPPKPVRDGKW